MSEREPQTIDLKPGEYRWLGERVLAAAATIPWWRRLLCLGLGLPLFLGAGYVLVGGIKNFGEPFSFRAIVAGSLCLYGGGILIWSAFVPPSLPPRYQ